ncbi:hypothetical protein HPB51_022593 [Rhipicephalus microplus]|uniref:Kynurenine formamidase n=1 Tax=Rhipicephalus microplus TaxID=6941 RepID=A0A9J6DXK5_RHIMP|nr:hypothetical protein HPB51_022593 [Rhipicephalus microplus]
MCVTRREREVSLPRCSRRERGEEFDADATCVASLAARTEQSLTMSSRYSSSDGIVFTEDEISMDSIWLQTDVVEDPIHGGTHFDAPLHFNKDGWDVSQVPLEMLLFVPVARVDVRHKVASDPAYLLTVDDILDWEKEHARLPDGCLFIAHTGQSKYWPNRTAYLGIQADGERRFPALTGDAASFLATQRSVNGVGLDTASVDASGYDAHRAILNANMFILENLVNLEKLPILGSYAVVLPLMLDGGSGSPVRVVAIVPRRKIYIYHSEDNHTN